MPNRDGTGPRQGMGRGMGRGAGRGFRNGRGAGFGQGMGRGCGRGRGFGRGVVMNGAAEAQMMEQGVMSGLIAVTAKGETLDADVDPRFGRAAGFVLVNAEGQQQGYIDNGSSDSMAHGAGLAAAEAIAKAGAKVLLTGHVGPKAAAALSAAGVQAVEHCEGQTVAEAVKGYQPQADAS